MDSSIQDYYALLEINRDASFEDIKRQFRFKAKKIHPDLQDQNAEAASQMRNLIEAYEVLSNPEARSEYDKVHQAVFNKDDFDYRSFLIDQADNESFSKLIFYDLLHNFENEAIELYTKLVTTKSFDLSSHLDREDFMDCAFLLAEEYEKSGNFAGSYNLLKTIADFEMEKPYFKHFFPEVILRLRSIVGQKMISAKQYNLTRQYLLELSDMEFSDKDRAYFIRKLGEIEFELENLPLAKIYFDESKKLDPKQSGLEKFEKKI